jgi:O-succinylbenzoate synthase
VRIEAVELHLVALPMVSPFRASHGTVAQRRVVLIHVVGPDGDGWGECAALPEPTYTAEFADGAFVVLRDHLAPRLLAAAARHGSAFRAEHVDEALSGVVGHPMAKAGLELAVLDLECRAHGSRPLAERLAGASATAVAAGAAVGLHRDVAALVDEVQHLVGDGYGRLKVKVAPGRDVDAMTAVREAVGPAVVLLADANGAYRSQADRRSPEHPDRLAALDQLGLAAIEQPLPAGHGDLAAHAELATRLATPIALDESLTSLDRLAEAVERGALAVACIKAPVLGGWQRAADALRRCQAAGLDAYVGGMLDAGPGRAGTLALATHPGATLAGDQSATSRTFADDVCPPVVVEGPPGAGSIAVPPGPGLGVEVDPAAVARLAVATATITAALTP